MHGRRPSRPPALAADWARPHACIAWSLPREQHPVLATRTKEPPRPKSSASSPVVDDATDNRHERQRSERADAEARQRRALPATIKKTAFHERIESPGFGRPPNPRWSMPRVDRRTGSSPFHGPGTTGLSPSPAPPSRGLGPGPPLRTLLQTTIRTTEPPDSKAGLFPIRSLLLRESLYVSFPPLIDMLKLNG
ncbi:hypothetical protein CQW23_35281 [Capsicum baccatum]|uniref:Uncharacterized protein n=1 Tax=Capsicum baccatum TaxID=33114 RepID=A0A2G2UWJ1_CAPBA|nr:hypothetical protein CQW23_35281 [Capsicum baccatum]